MKLSVSLSMHLFSTSDTGENQPIEKSFIPAFLYFLQTFSDILYMLMHAFLLEHFAGKSNPDDFQNASQVV